MLSLDQVKVLLCGYGPSSGRCNFFRGSTLPSALPSFTLIFAVLPFFAATFTRLEDVICFRRIY
jgi:hypothetical protein